MKPITYLLPAAAIILIAATTGKISTEQPASTKYIPTSSGYIMVLKQGEDVLSAIEELTSRERIPSASFSGIGFVDATFGYFNAETKSYEPQKFENVELAGLNGSIAWQDDKPSVHMHGVAANKRFEAVGGHLLAATVGNGSVEIYITVYKQRLLRVKDEATGANILRLE